MNNNVEISPSFRFLIGLILAGAGCIAGWMLVPEPTNDTSPVVSMSIPVEVAESIPDVAQSPAEPTVEELWGMARQPNDDADETTASVMLLREIDRIATFEGVGQRIEEILQFFVTWEDEEKLTETVTEEDSRALLWVFKLLILRLGEIDPVKAYEFVVQHDLFDYSRYVMLEIAKREPEELIRIASEIKSKGLDMDIFLQAVPMLADTHPEQALTLFSTYEARRNSYLRQFFSRWARRAPEVAAQRALALNGDDRGAVVMAVLDVWSKMNAAAAFAWTKENDSDNADGFLGKAIVAMAQTNPREAAQLAMELVNDESATLAAVGNRWLVDDIDAAFEWLLGLEDPVLQSGILGYQSDYATKQPEKVIEWLGKFPMNQRIAGSFNSLMSRLGEHNLPVAVDWLKNSERVEALESARNTVFYKWLNSDPDAAADYAAANPELIIDDGLAAEIARNVADRDPVKALEWSQSLQSAECRRDATRISIAILINASPEIAIAALNELEGVADRDVMLPMIMNGLLNQSLEEAEQWVSSLPESEQRALAPKMLSKFFDDPKSFGEMLGNPLFYDADTGDLTKQANTAVENMVHGLADHTSPEYVLEWAVSLPPEISVAVMKHAVYNWAREDAVEAAEFVSEFPEGETRQAAIARIVEPIANVDPERAWEWAMMLKSPEIQLKAIKDVIYDWGEVDRVAARAALTKAPITEAQRERIESRIRFRWREE